VDAKKFPDDFKNIKARLHETESCLKKNESMIWEILNTIVDFDG